MIVLHLLEAVLLTCLIETPLICQLFSKYKLKSLIFNTILINCITNLTLNLFVIAFHNITWICIFICIAELLIPIIEWQMFLYCYNELPLKKVLFISYFVNACSFIIGLCI